MKKIFTIIILTIGLITFANAQGITNTLGGNTAADKFIVENSDSEASLVITGEGNVGIGTTGPGSGFNTKLDVVGSTSFRTNSGDPSKGIKIDVFGTSHRIYSDATSGTPYDLILGTYPNGHINQLVLQQSSGNVGIGTSTPTSKLYIEDSQGAGSNTPILTINNTAPNGQNMVDFQHDGTTRGRLRSVGNGGFFIENKANSDIRMMTNDEVRMTIKNDGKVGIWTTSPSQILEVNGKIKIGTDGTTPTAGTIRFLNGHFEGYDGTTWKQLDN